MATTDGVREVQTNPFQTQFCQATTHELVVQDPARQPTDSEKTPSCGQRLWSIGCKCVPVVAAAGSVAVVALNQMAWDANLVVGTVAGIGTLMASTNMLQQIAPNTAKKVKEVSHRYGWAFYQIAVEFTQNVNQTNRALFAPLLATQQIIGEVVMQDAYGVYKAEEKFVDGSVIAESEGLLRTVQIKPFISIREGCCSVAVGSVAVACIALDHFYPGTIFFDRYSFQLAAIGGYFLAKKVQRIWCKERNRYANTLVIEKNMIHKSLDLLSRISMLYPYLFSALLFSPSHNAITRKALEALAGNVYGASFLFNWDDFCQKMKVGIPGISSSNQCITPQRVMDVFLATVFGGFFITQYAGLNFSNGKINSVPNIDYVALTSALASGIFSGVLTYYVGQKPLDTRSSSVQKVAHFVLIQQPFMLFAPYVVIMTGLEIDDREIQHSDALRYVQIITAYGSFGGTFVADLVKKRLDNLPKSTTHGTPFAMQATLGAMRMMGVSP